jgi:hypothetical protein
MLNTNERIIKHKVGLLNLVEELYHVVIPPISNSSYS